MTLSANEKTPPGGQRIMALWFPHLAADRIFRQRFGRSWRCRPPAAAIAPLVFSQRESNTQRLAGFDARAEALGLRIGLGLAEARAMHPSIEVVEADPQADARLLEGLADWCDRYTPLVAIDGADGLFLDITGCAHLFGGERMMLDNVMTFLFHQGFDVHAGLASTPGAAWAAARHPGEAVVPAGGEAERIAPLPLAALRLDASTRVGLESVGLRVAGALMAAPRAPLVRRFGKMVTLRLDQALGHVEEPISPRLPVPALSVERHFAEPIGLMEDIEALVATLARQLKSDLERRCEGARGLQLQLFRADGVVTRIMVSASRPLRDPKLIQKLFHERLAALTGDIDAGYGFDLIRLCVLVVARLEDEQGDLSGGDGRAAGDIALFTDRVRARLGERTVSMPQRIESHWPERAAIAAPYSAPRRTFAASEPPSPRNPKERPLRLFDPPECVDVTIAEVPEGPPGQFRWRHVSYRVARAEGPERIAPEWWRDGGEARSRDYFRIEDPDGRRYWLFREGMHDGLQSPPRWYMQGLFA